MLQGSNTKELSAAVADLFKGTSFPARNINALRLLICPFQELISIVPRGSSVLDAGCGSGLFLGLLHSTGRLRIGVGFDFSRNAIAIAKSLGLSQVRFELLDATTAWPHEPATFDVVSLIDVMHHVPPSSQHDVFRTAASRVSPGGILLYKDMCRTPSWRAWANRLHDLVMARQWIHYAPVSLVEQWAVSAGFVLERSADINMLWYGHELRVFRRNSSPA